jgi:hypothetical protein
MDEKPKKPTMADSPTGTLSRPNFEDLKSQQREPAQPRFSVPEDEGDRASITGIMYINSEGLDAAKNDDDSPTKSATKG